MVYQLLHKIESNLDKIRKKKLIDQEIDSHDTIIIAGAPRSGTTWLAEIIENIPEYSSVLEPLNPAWFPLSYKVGFRPHMFLPNNADWKEGKKHLEDILTGKVISIKPLYRLTPSNIVTRLSSNKLVVKFIRANLILPWISENFKYRAIIFIIRHPCAVVLSQLRTGFCGYTHPGQPDRNYFPKKEEILNEACKIKFINKDLLKKIQNISSVEEILAVLWCLDNLIPLYYLKNNKPSKWIFTTYEQLSTDGLKEIHRICDIIQEKKGLKNMLKHLEVPSITTFMKKSSNVTKNNLQISKWKRDLSEKQIEKILNIVNWFNLDLYNYDSLPDDNFLEKWSLI